MYQTTYFRKQCFRSLLLLSVAASAVDTFTSSTFAQTQPGRQGSRPVNATPASSKTTVPADGSPLVAAVVNGQPISINELAQQCRLRFGEEILEDLVNKTLIYQACQAQQITISEKDVDAEISRIASKFNLSTPMYLKLIEDERDISRGQYAADIIWPMLALRSLARSSITVTPQEIDKEFQGEFGPKVKVRMIACKDQNKLAQLQKRAIAQPELFKTLAKEHSEDSVSASVEGLLPPIRRYSGDDELETVAFNLQPNEVSKILSAGEMFVILQCVHHMPGATPPAPQMQEIQNRIKSDLEDRKLRDSAESVYETLRKNGSTTIVHGKPELESQYPGVAAIVNGQSIAMDYYDKECVKRYGKRILEGEINRKLIENTLSASKLQVSQEDINAEMSEAATYFGFLTNSGAPDVNRWIESIQRDEGMTAELYIRDVIWPTVALKKLTQGQVQVTEEDLRKGFESNYGPRAEVLAIVLSNQRTAQQVWDLARNNPTEKFFGELASQYSVEDSSKSNFGKVPPLRKHGGQPNLEKAAFELEPGKISGIIEVGGRYVILRSQGFTSPVVQDFNAVKNEVYKDLLEKKQRFTMDQYLRKLRDNAEIADYLDPKKSRVSASETAAVIQQLQKDSVR